MNAFQPELFVPRECGDLKSLKDAATQVVEYLKNLMPGTATIVLLIKPDSDQCLVIKSVSLGAKEPGTKRDGEDYYSSLSREKENALLSQITIKVIKEDGDGMSSCDVLTI